MKKILLPILLLSTHLSAASYITQINNQDLISNVVVESTDKTPSCELPLVLNSTSDSCVDTLLKLDWLETSDSCGGVRQSSFNNKIFYLRANTTFRNYNPVIPEGYHWMSVEEYNSVKAGFTNQIHTYSNKCGINNYPYINGYMQAVFTFSNSVIYYVHTGGYETNVKNGSIENTINWAGIVVYKDF